jgi:hypothetical protein
MMRFKLANKLTDSNLPEGIKSVLTKGIWKSPYNEVEKEKEIIFIHVPKSAGRSVREAVGLPRDGHDRALWYKFHDSEKFRRYFKFTVVRNPWDRLVSAYFYLTQDRGHETTQKWVDKNLHKYKSFNEFALSLKKENVRRNILSWTHFLPQYKWISDSEENILVDFVAKLENLQNDLCTIREKINVDKKLNVINESKRNDYKSYYDKETAKIVGRVYEKDVRYLGYSY